MHRETGDAKYRTECNALREVGKTVETHLRMVTGMEYGIGNRWCDSKTC